MLICAFLGDILGISMSFSVADIEKTAQLARLSVTEEDCSFYAEQLNRIFELVEQMSAIDTDKIEPMAHPQDIALRLREDEVSEQNQRELFQSVAPETEQGLYLVPKVIE